MNLHALTFEQILRVAFLPGGPGGDQDNDPGPRGSREEHSLSKAGTHRDVERARDSRRARKARSAQGLKSSLRVVRTKGEGRGPKKKRLSDRVRGCREGKGMQARSDMRATSIAQHRHRSAFLASSAGIPQHIAPMDPASLVLRGADGLSRRHKLATYCNFIQKSLKRCAERK